MSLIELHVFRMKARGGKTGGVQVKAVVYREEVTGVEDCTKAHRSIMPRLELAFPGQDIYLEVSSPGTDRLIKDGSEFGHFIGRGINCYRTDISDWTAGILLAADDKKVMLKGESGEIALPYEIIAKARLKKIEGG
jgi:ribosome maturation factor RimP